MSTAVFSDQISQACISENKQLVTSCTGAISLLYLASSTDSVWC